MIYFEKEKMLFHLTTEKTSYIFAFYAGKYPVHLYWGKKLRGPVADIKCFPSVAATVRTMSALNDLENSFSSDSAPMEFSTFGNPDLRIPCFHAKYKNGAVISDFRYVSHEIYQGKRPLDGLPATYVEDDSEATSLDILLRDDLTGVEVTLRYTVFEELNAITRSVLVVNRGDDAFFHQIHARRVDLARDDVVKAVDNQPRQTVSFRMDQAVKRRIDQSVAQGDAAAQFFGDERGVDFRLNVRRDFAKSYQ